LESGTSGSGHLGSGSGNSGTGNGYRVFCLGLRVDTVFLEKQVKRGSREAADEKQSVIGRLKEEENDQHDSQMVKRTQPDSRPNGQDDRPMVNQEIDR
jgi:hypothetical protein